jgi:hypothetical protein
LCLFEVFPLSDCSITQGCVFVKGFWEILLNYFLL